MKQRHTSIAALGASDLMKSLLAGSGGSGGAQQPPPPPPKLPEDIT